MTFHNSDEWRFLGLDFVPYTKCILLPFSELLIQKVREFIVVQQTEQLKINY